MRNLGTKLYVKAQDWRLQRDEEGLTILAYALGAAFVVIPTRGRHDPLWAIGQRQSERRSRCVGYSVSRAVSGAAGRSRTFPRAISLARGNRPQEQSRDMD